jgi:hypothetical protein
VVAAERELHTTRPFAAGPFAFTLAASDPDDARLVETLFDDLPPPADGRVPSAFVLMRSTDGNGGRRWSLAGPRLDDQTVSSLSAVLVRLMTAVNLAALDADPTRLHLHAAAATKQRRAVVLAAQRGVGKTTTAAHLLARGWTFLTDETVSVAPDAPAVSGFPKPLSIKPFGGQHVEHLSRWMVPAVDEGTETFRFVRAGCAGATASEAAPCHLIVLLRRSADGAAMPSAVSRPVHPVDAVVALMQESLDAERFGPAAARLAALAAASHCHELMIGPPADTAALVEELFDVAPATPLEVRVLPPSAATSPGVVTVAIGDRAVVHDQGSGRIFALDAAAARIWDHLGGWVVDPSIDPDGPGVAPFVAQLRALGVLDAQTARR